MNNEIIYVCQVPDCGAMAETWDKDTHQYYYCFEHAAEWGWCVNCAQYVSPDGIYAYDMCPDCLELLPEENADINAAIDDVLANEPQCPHCEGIDIVLTHDGGFCNSCDQMFDAAVTGDG